MSEDCAAVLSMFPTIDPLAFGREGCCRDPSRRLQCTETGRLRTLKLKGFNLEGALPSSLGLLPELVNLDLSNNMFTGDMSVGISNLTKLERLDLSTNRFNTGLANLSSVLTGIQYLNVEGNPLRAPIPYEIGRLSNLTSLNLGSIEATGLIPDSIGGIQGLQFLQMGQNNLTGGIPASFAGLGNLELFHIYRNKFTGPLPTFLTNMPKLRDFRVDGNRFNGSLNEVNSMLSTMAIVYLNDNCYTDDFNAPTPDNHFYRPQSENCAGFRPDPSPPSPKPSRAVLAGILVASAVLLTSILALALFLLNSRKARLRRLRAKSLRYAASSSSSSQHGGSRSGTPAASIRTTDTEETIGLATRTTTVSSVATDSTNATRGSMSRTSSRFLTVSESGDDVSVLATISSSPPSSPVEKQSQSGLFTNAVSSPPIRTFSTRSRRDTTPGLFRAPSQTASNFAGTVAAAVAAAAAAGNAETGEANKGVMVDPMNPVSWSVEQVSVWLAACGFSEAILTVFKEHAVDGSRLLSFTSDKLKREMGIASFGLRTSLVVAIDELRISEERAVRRSRSVHDFPLPPYRER